MRGTRCPAVASSQSARAPNGWSPTVLEGFRRAATWCSSSATPAGGMDDATLARAMEPFFTTKGVGKGTGLGLSMVHGLAEQLGGRLVLKSKKGEGTTAELWLPVAEVEPVAVHDELQAPEEVVSPRTGPLVVVVVDDDNL